MAERLKLKRFPGDSSWVLYLAVVGFSLVYAIFAYLAAIAPGARDNFFVVLLVLYGLTNSGYAVWTTATYRNHIDLIEATHSKNERPLRRYGEFVGAGLVMWLFTIAVLVSFGTGSFQTVPWGIDFAIDITVGILAASSAIKLYVEPSYARHQHNRTLLLLTVFSTFAIMLLIGNNFWGSGPEVGEGLVLSYTVILTSYVTHNLLAWTLSPKMKQDRPGHFMPVFVLVLTVIMLFAWWYDPSKQWPVEATFFYAVTILWLATGRLLRYFLEKHLVQSRYNRTVEEHRKICEQYSNKEDTF